MRQKILKVIDKNSKLTCEELASMLGMTKEVVEAEIKAMEEEAVICGYPTLINWDKTESEKVTALIEVKVTPQRGEGFDKIAERIYKFEEVESVYLMSGGFDLTVIIDGKSMKEVANFVSSKLAPMEAVLSTATHFVLKKYKEHGMTMESKKVDERMLVTP
ncbi:MAG TPA: Lrp/AsnC family transcriptional regulator [Lachnospiraceae bacterium]|jgi:DNA-binding Lrp family transcriptional regulator|nr:Lrp/AsnC family transcriptional regulator [Lachnospiraceae bacterium]